MRKIILNQAASLDGYIEGPNGEYDWCFTDQDYGMAKFYDTIDVVIMGRKSYEMIMADPEAFADKKICVFSDTLLIAMHDNAEIISRAQFKQRVEEIRNEDGGNIWLFGGADLVTSFIKANLITILVLSVHPVILGAGKRLFDGADYNTELILEEHQAFSSGLIQLKYLLKPKLDYSLFIPGSI